MIEDKKPNLLIAKDLLAEIGISSYDADVTEEEFWRSVGQRLGELRKARGFTLSDIQKDGGPTNKTVQDIETGNIGQVSKLNDYVKRIDVNLIDVFRAVLKTDIEERSQELQLVIREFTLGGVLVQGALYANAKLSEQTRLRQSPGSPDAPPVTRQGKSRAASATARRRGAK